MVVYTVHRTLGLQVTRWVQNWQNRLDSACLKECWISILVLNPTSSSVCLSLPPPPPPPPPHFQKKCAKWCLEVFPSCLEEWAGGGWLLIPHVDNFLSLPLFLSLSLSQDGVWIKGLYLEGAGWDKRTSCLVDSRAMELVHPMPTIHFKPIEGKRRSTKG